MCVYTANMTIAKASYDVSHFSQKATAGMKWFGFRSLLIRNPVIPGGTILFILSI